MLFLFFSFSLSRSFARSPRKDVLIMLLSHHYYLFHSAPLYVFVFARVHILSSLSFFSTDIRLRNSSSFFSCQAI